MEPFPPEVELRLSVLQVEFQVPVLRPRIVLELETLRTHCSARKAFAAKLQAKGVKLDAPYGKDPELGISTVTLTDPFGTTIRLTEGLSKVAGVTPYTYIDGFVTTDK